MVLHVVCCPQKCSLEEVNFAICFPAKTGEGADRGIWGERLINSIYRHVIIPHFKPQALLLSGVPRSQVFPVFCKYKLAFTDALPILLCKCLIFSFLYIVRLPIAPLSTGQVQKYIASCSPPLTPCF